MQGTATDTIASDQAQTMPLLIEKKTSKHTTKAWHTRIYHKNSSNGKHTGKIDNTTHMHDNSHIHWASSIHGLPPKLDTDNQLTDNTMTQETGLSKNSKPQRPSVRLGRKNQYQWPYLQKQMQPDQHRSCQSHLMHTQSIKEWNLTSQEWCNN